MGGVAYSDAFEFIFCSCFFVLNATFMPSLWKSPKGLVLQGQEEKNGLYLSSLWLWIRIINPSPEPFQSPLLHTLKMEGMNS